MSKPGTARFFADLFSGKGGVATALRKLGFMTKEYESLRGVDLCSKKTQLQLLADIRTGKIAGVMLATPCTTLSRARRKRLRSLEQPWGVDGLNESELKQLKDGNACLRFSLRVIRLCLKKGVPFILENPLTSMIWGFAEMQRIASNSATHFREADFCQFGTRWKKPTRFLCGHLHEEDTSGLQRRCSGPRGFCSRTGARHFILEGPGPGGVPRTRTAQPYPPRLCSALSWALSNPCRTDFLARATTRIKK